MNFKDFFTPLATGILPAKGRILIAEPLLQGKHFSRSVILITEHNENGTMGFVLNKPVLIPEKGSVVDIFPTCKSPLFLGGPVHTDHLFFIHTLGSLIPKSRLLFGELFWGGDLNTVQELLEQRLISSNEIRFFTGYAGWSLGQLEEELQQHAWVISLLDTNTLMNEKNLWEFAVKDLGSPYRHWLHFPEKPHYN